MSCISARSGQSTSVLLLDLPGIEHAKQHARDFVLYGAVVNSTCSVILIVVFNAKCRHNRRNFSNLCMQTEKQCVKTMSSVVGEASTMLQNACDQMVEVKIDAAPTHEVANCSPKLKVTPASAV